MTRPTKALVPLSILALALSSPVKSQSSTNVLVRPHVDHVMRRVGFGPTAGQLKTWNLTDLNDWVAEQLVGAAVFDDTTGPIQALVDHENGARPTLGNQSTHDWNEGDLANLLLARAIWSPNQLREKMSVFWHQHFNTMTERLRGFYKQHFSNDEAGALAVYAELEQFDAFRAKGLSTFRELLGVSLNGAPMRIYLHATQNDGNDTGDLNEDLARELLELHTVGPEDDYGNANYDQDDVQDLARFISGWYVDTSSAEVEILNDHNDHDFGPLSLFDDPASMIETIEIADHTSMKTPSQMGRRIQELIDKLAKHELTKRFVCRKLARYFVRDWEPANAPDSLIDSMTAAWGNDGDIDAVLAILFNSAHFNSVGSYKRLIRTPLESAASTMRLFEKAEFSDPAASHAAFKKMAARVSVSMNQRLFRFVSPDGYSIKSRDQAGVDRALQRMKFAWTRYTAGSGTVNESALSVQDVFPTLNLSLSDSANAVANTTLQVLFPGHADAEDLVKAELVLNSSTLNGAIVDWSSSSVTVTEKERRLRVFASYLIGLRHMHIK